MFLQLIVSLYSLGGEFGLAISSIFSRDTKYGHRHYTTVTVKCYPVIIDYSK